MVKFVKWHKTLQVRRSKQNLDGRDDYFVTIPRKVMSLLKLQKGDPLYVRFEKVPAAVPSPSPLLLCDLTVDEVNYCHSYKALKDDYFTRSGIDFFRAEGIAKYGGEDRVKAMLSLHGVEW